MSDTNDRAIARLRAEQPQEQPQWCARLFPDDDTHSARVTLRLSWHELFGDKTEVEVYAEPLAAETAASLETLGAIWRGIKSAEQPQGEHEGAQCATCGDLFTSRAEHEQHLTTAHPPLPLPVPGEGGCPEWARWIAWDVVRNIRGEAYFCESEPWSGRKPSHGDYIHGDYIGGRTEAAPRSYDDPSRAGQCLPLPPRSQHGAQP